MLYYLAHFLLLYKGGGGGGGEVRVSNSYNIVERRWSRIYANENASPAYWSRQQAVEPRPRYAHQLVSKKSANLKK